MPMIEAPHIDHYRSDGITPLKHRADEPFKNGPQHSALQTFDPLPLAGAGRPVAEHNEV